MSCISELAEKFGMSVKELEVRSGYSRQDLYRILETDHIVYPGEFRELMDRLIVQSLKLREYDERVACERDCKRREYLNDLAFKHGVSIEPVEDPCTF